MAELPRLNGIIRALESGLMKEQGASLSLAQKQALAGFRLSFDRAPGDRAPGQNTDFHRACRKILTAIGWLALDSAYKQMLATTGVDL